jgi:hypothetical protein
MSSEASEQTMALLQELAGLKEIDSQKRARTQQEKMARQERQRRRLEIHKQIKEVAEAKRNETGETKDNRD